MFLYASWLTFVLQNFISPSSNNVPTSIIKTVSNYTTSKQDKIVKFIGIFSVYVACKQGTIAVNLDFYPIT